MITKSLRLTFCSLLLVTLYGCGFWQNTAEPELNQAADLTQIDENLTAFTTINASGPFRIELREAKKHRVEVKGPAPQLQQLVLQVEGESLRLHAQRLGGDAQVMDVVISAPYIHKLILDGQVSLSANDFDSRRLDLELAHSGDVDLSGRIGVHRVVVKGHGHTTIKGVDSQTMMIEAMDQARLTVRGVAQIESINARDDAQVDVYWVDSPEMMIQLRDQASVRLAGIAGLVQTNTSDRAFLDARYLRVRESFVKAFDESTQEIATIENENVLASDRSTVYSHKNSDLMNHFMAYNGSVLDVDSLWADDIAYIED